MARKNNSHKDCDHPKTTGARRACNKGPEALAYFIAHMDPDEQEAIRQRKAEYEESPEVKVHRAEYYARPEVKVHRAEYYARPEVKARHYARDAKRRRQRADTQVEPVCIKRQVAT
jgi:hypothetical protein